MSPSDARDVIGAGPRSARPRRTAIVLEDRAGRQVGGLDAVDDGTALDGDAAPDRVDPRDAGTVRGAACRGQDDPVAGAPDPGLADRPIGPKSGPGSSPAIVHVAARAQPGIRIDERPRSRPGSP